MSLPVDCSAYNLGDIPAHLLLTHISPLLSPLRERELLSSLLSQLLSNIVDLWHKNEFIYFYLSETIVAAEEEEFWQELVMAEVGGLLDRKGKLEGLY